VARPFVRELGPGIPLAHLESALGITQTQLDRLAFRYSEISSLTPGAAAGAGAVVIGESCQRQAAGEEYAEACAEFHGLSPD